MQHQDSDFFSFCYDMALLECWHIKCVSPLMENVFTFSPIYLCMPVCKHREM